MTFSLTKLPRNSIAAFLYVYNQIAIIAIFFRTELFEVLSLKTKKVCHVKQLPQQTVNVEGQYLGFRDRLGQNFCKSVPENMALYKRILTRRDRRTDFYYLYSSKGKKYIFICIGRWAKIVLSLTYICIGCFC